MGSKSVMSYFAAHTPVEPDQEPHDNQYKCEKCDKWIPNLEKNEHEDYHFALELSRNEYTQLQEHSQQQTEIRNSAKRKPIPSSKQSDGKKSKLLTSYFTSKQKENSTKED